MFATISAFVIVAIQYKNKGNNYQNKSNKECFVFKEFKYF
jgi:hypothetical protein